MDTSRRAARWSGSRSPRSTVPCATLSCITSSHPHRSAPTARRSARPAGCSSPSLAPAWIWRCCSPHACSRSVCVRSCSSRRSMPGSGSGCTPRPFRRRSTTTPRRSESALTPASSSPSRRPGSRSTTACGRRSRQRQTSGWPICARRANSFSGSISTGPTRSASSRCRRRRPGSATAPLRLARRRHLLPSSRPPRPSRCSTPKSSNRATGTANLKRQRHGLRTGSPDFLT